MPVPTRKASLSIKFIIVGGGIAGLSCGYALQTAGHQVVILEQSDGKSKTEGSIRSPPNMTRILCKWPGMLALLKTCATKCSGISFRDGKTSEPLGFMKFHEQIMSELEADFLVLQYEDLCRHLTFLCVGTGVEFKYASKAVNIKSVGGSVTVVLEDGRNVEGDIAIGADGHNSLVRSIVAEEDLEPIHVVPGANISILTQLMQEDEDLRDLCNTHQSEFTIWMGSGSSMTGTFDANAETFNLSICSMTTLDSPDSEWYENYPLSKMTSFEFSGYDPRFLFRFFPIFHFVLMLALSQTAKTYSARLRLPSDPTQDL
ncbi:hypothetical protein B0H10DRAFT_875432 [Mycena sp. CBHHK59/15]|nr:hypothetical protein B0H10DRAFT_875432 [Mycena sp. CBHHK59/15]